jgi:hypothetical protein
MKSFVMLFFIFAAATLSPAQTATTESRPSDLQIVKMSWKSDSRLAQDAYREAEDAAAVQPPERAARRVRTTRGERLSGYDNAERAMREVEEMWPSNGPRINGYLYQITVRNTGQKKIKAVNWQYIFTDSLDQTIVTRHKFQSRENISPGKEAKLTRFSVVAPTHVINAKAVENNAKESYLEQVLITRIEYADGSIWEPAAN